MVAAWPLYMFSRQELAPVEDQSHISLFIEASPDSTLAATNRESSADRARRITSFPEAEFMWSLTAAWGGFGGMVAKDWHERARIDRGDVRRGVRRGVAGAGPARVPPPRSAAAHPGPVRRRARAAERRAARADARDGRRRARRRLAERQVPLCRHRSEDRPARGARRDRPRAARRPRARPGERRPGAGHAARRRVREPVQLFRPQLQGHSRRSATKTARRSVRCSISRSRPRAASSCRSRRSRTSKRARRRAP